MFFFFNDTATPEIYTLSLHDALPISRGEGDGLMGSGFRSQRVPEKVQKQLEGPVWQLAQLGQAAAKTRSEEHTSELQSRLHLVCRLLLGKKTTTQCVRQHNHNSLYTA